MNFNRRKKSRLPGVDLTPMIDVTLQLIIFFMYTAQFSQVSRTPIDLPEQPGETDALDPAALVVDLDADGQFLVEQTPLSLDELMARLEAEIRKDGPQSVDLLVRADRDSSAANINQLAERLAAAGVRTWKLGTIERRR